MKSLLIYGSRTGNTRTIAETIAETLGRSGPVETFSVEEVPATLPEADLIVIGAPTEKHGLYEPMLHFLDGLGERALEGRLAAAFDTRLWWPRMLSGSAAELITERLHQLSARVIGPAASFIVTMKPALQPGEVERAVTWAETLAKQVEANLAPVG